MRPIYTQVIHRDPVAEENKLEKHEKRQNYITLIPCDPLGSIKSFFFFLNVALT